MFNKKIASVVLATAMTLGGVATANAAVANPNANGATANPMASVLSALVTKGTITQAQADAITAAFAAARPAMPAKPAKPLAGAMGGHEGKGERGMMGGFGMNTAARQAIITSTLGITAADLLTARKAGKSLATLAGDKTSTLIAAIVNYDSTQIDAAVASGALTSAKAVTMKAGLTARVTQEVNNVGHGPDGDNDHGMTGGAPKIPTTSGASSSKKAVFKTASTGKKA